MVGEADLAVKVALAEDRGCLVTVTEVGDAAAAVLVYERLAEPSAESMHSRLWH